MKLGVIPICDKAVTTNPAWVKPFVQMLEGEGVESVWMPEHVVMAEEYATLRAKAYLEHIEEKLVDIATDLPVTGGLTR